LSVFYRQSLFLHFFPLIAFFLAFGIAPALEFV